MKFYTFITLIILSSCSNQVTLPGDYKIQFIPEKGINQKLNSNSITYIIPKSSVTSEGIYGLMFLDKHWGTETEQEKITNKFHNSTLNVERRTDNGIAGSGRKYTINVSTHEEGNNLSIIFNPTNISTYQDGLILPFPLPDFDINSYLTTAYVNYNIELSAGYPVDSIKANFKRMVEQIDDFVYHMKLSNARVSFKLDLYPYRNNSKVIIKATILEMKDKNGVINVDQNIREFEEKIRKVIND